MTEAPGAPMPEGEPVPEGEPLPEGEEVPEELLDELEEELEQAPEPDDGE